MRMFETMFHLGLGALSLTKDKMEEHFDEMVERGELSREEARKTMDDMVKRGQEEKEEFRSMIRDEVQDWRKDVSSVTKEQLEKLEARIAELEKKFE
ncbi:MAG: hypothetical protein U9N81_13700 [Bacillota bacterium]|nr:hypothetical protein [Bacillota bacterium]